MHRFSFILIFCLIISVIPTTGQDKHVVDSLNRILQRTEKDTTRVWALLSLGEEIHPFNLDAAINHWEEANSISDSIILNQPDNKAMNRLLVGKSESISNIGYGHSVKGNLDTALELYFKAFEINKQLDDKKALSTSYNNIGFVYKKMGQIDKAGEYYEKSLEIRKELGDKKSIALGYNNVANLLLSQGKIEKALEYNFESLKIRQKLNYNSGIAQSLNNIGAIYLRQKEMDKALEYYKESLRLREDEGHREGIAVSLNNVGNIYNEMGEYEKALEFWERSLVIYNEIGSKSGIALMYNNMAMAYKNKGDSEKNFEYNMKALKIREEVGAVGGIIISCYNIASNYYFKGNILEAEKYASRAYELAKKRNFPDRIQLTANLLSKIYKKKGKYQKAFEMYQLSVKMRDSLHNEENQKAIIRSLMKSEYEKEKLADSLKHAKETELASLTISEQQAKLKQEQTQRYALYGGLALVAFLAFVLFRGFQRKKKDNIFITKQKEEVENQKMIVDEKNREILDSINYAKRLQEAILPPSRQVNELLGNNFILYKPKDIVAGDFYWVESSGDSVFFAAADCTGHGVPGALVSVVCSNALERSVKEFGITDPGKILTQVTKLVIETFEKSEKEVKDGMDVAICRYDKKKRELYYAGANNPLYHIRAIVDPDEANDGLSDGRFLLTEYKPTRQPVGKSDDFKEFTSAKVQITSGDRIFIFSDGFPDQFGGPDGKKYKYKAFKKFLLSVQDKPMDEQKQLINDEFESWRGSEEQLDDVCIIGVLV